MTKYGLAAARRSARLDTRTGTRFSEEMRAGWGAAAREAGWVLCGGDGARAWLECEAARARVVDPRAVWTSVDGGSGRNVAKIRRESRILRRLPVAATRVALRPGSPAERCRRAGAVSQDPGRAMAARPGRRATGRRTGSLRAEPGKAPFLRSAHDQAERAVSSAGRLRRRPREVASPAAGRNRALLRERRGDGARGWARHSTVSPREEDA